MLRRIARLFAPIVSEIYPDVIGGTELGGVIIATAVSQMTGLPMIVVRKQPKQYGAFAEEYVEGPFTPASTCCCSRTSSPADANCWPRGRSSRS